MSGGYEKELEEIEEIGSKFEDYKSHRAIELASKCIKDGQMEIALSLLEHDNLSIRTGAAEALSKYHIENENWDGVKQLLQSDDNGAWNGSYWALYEFITIKCSSIDKLHDIGILLEASLREWSNSKPRALNIQRQYQEAVSDLLIDIGEKIKHLDKGKRFSDLEWKRPRNSVNKKRKNRY